LNITFYSQKRRINACVIFVCFIFVSEHHQQRKEGLMHVSFLCASYLLVSIISKAASEHSAGSSSKSSEHSAVTSSSKGSEQQACINSAVFCYHILF
jgi:hypothetical protein